MIRRLWERAAANREERPQSARRLYLIAGTLVIVLFVEEFLQKIGVVHTPAEASLPGWLYTILVAFTFAVGFMLFFGWPFAIAGVVVLWGDWLMMTPALLFLGADATLATYLFTGEKMPALFALGGVLLGLFGLAALGVGLYTNRART